MPVFLQGRRAFLSSLRRRHRRCNPLSVHRVTNSGRAYPHRAYSCFTYSCRACPAAAAACHSYSHLASPAAAACHSYPHLASSAAAAACHSFPHFAYFAAAALGYRSAARTATPPAWSEMPPRTASLLQFCPEHHHPEAPHGLRMFSCPAGSTDTARASFAVLPGAPTVRSSPPPSCPETRPAPLLLFCPGSPSRLCPGHKKGGRNRTEARPPPKSNQSVAAASPRQVIWLSGKSPFLKVGIRTPGNTRSSPAPKRTVFRYRAALRKVHHQANKATSRRSRTDN